MVRIPHLAGRHCPHCGSTRTHEADGGNKMPYRCSDCREYFSVKTNSLMHNSRLPLRKWVFATYLHLTRLKGVSSVKLHRDIGVSQKTAWYMLQRIRKAFEDDDESPFQGPVEVDETYIGGKRKELTGRGVVGKTAVIGAKDRATNRVSARPIGTTDKPTLQGFVRHHAAQGATIYTDEHGSCKGMPFAHEAVNHCVSEYVREENRFSGWVVGK